MGSVFLADLLLEERTASQKRNAFIFKSGNRVLYFSEQYIILAFLIPPMNNNKSIFPKLNREALTDFALLFAVFIMAVIYKMMKMP